MVDNHAYFQTKGDQVSSVLKNEANKPSNWMHKPTASEVDQFETIVKNLELSAKKVRKKLINQWIQEELNSKVDTVARLQWLRTSTSKENVWPCHCGNVG